jgi:O-antigen/teichoic acid export membrane protein
MGNYLGPREFSVIIAILSLISLLGLPLGALESETATLVALDRKEGATWSNHGYFIRHRIGAKGEASIFICCTLLGFIAVYPIVESEIALLSIGFGVLMLIYSRIRTHLGVFQGVQNFRMMAIIAIMNSSTRLVVGTLAVIIGMGVLGGALGVFTGFLVALSVSVAFIGKDREESEKHASALNNDMLKAMSLLCLLGWVMNWDYLFAIFILEEENLAVYAFTLVLGKAALILAFPIIGSLVPKLAMAVTAPDATKILREHVGGYLAFALPVVFLLHLYQVSFLEIIFFNSEVDFSSVRVDVLFLGYVGVGLLMIITYAAISQRNVSHYIPLLALSLAFPIFGLFSSANHVDLAWVVVATSWSLFLVCLSDYWIWPRLETAS